MDETTDEPTKPMSIKERIAAMKLKNETTSFSSKDEVKRTSKNNFLSERRMSKGSNKSQILLNSEETLTDLEFEKEGKQVEIAMEGDTAVVTEVEEIETVVYESHEFKDAPEEASEGTSPSAEESSSDDDTDIESNRELSSNEVVEYPAEEIKPDEISLRETSNIELDSDEQVLMPTIEPFVFDLPEAAMPDVLFEERKMDVMLEPIIIQEAKKIDSGSVGTEQAEKFIPDPVVMEQSEEIITEPVVIEPSEEIIPVPVKEELSDPATVEQPRDIFIEPGVKEQPEEAILAPVVMEQPEDPNPETVAIEMSEEHISEPAVKELSEESIPEPAAIELSEEILSESVVIEEPISEPAVIELSEETIPEPAVIKQSEESIPLQIDSTSIMSRLQKAIYSPKPPMKDSSSLPSLGAIEEQPSVKKVLPKPPVPLGFDILIWRRIFIELEQHSIAAISQTCSTFEEVIESVGFQAQYHLNKSGKEMCLNIAAKNHILTVEFVDELIEIGAFLPKILIERLFSEFSSGNASTATREAFVALLPSAYRLYPDLNLVSINSQDAFVSTSILISQVDEEAPCTNDQIGYDLCFGSGSCSRIDVEELTRIVTESHFVPALAPPFTETGWQDLFQGIYRLFKQDSPANEKRKSTVTLIIPVAIYLANNSGSSQFIELFLSEAFHDLESTCSTISYICDKGIELNAATVSYMITNTERPVHIHREVVKLLRDCLPADELMDFVSHSLSILLSNEELGRIPIIDYLLTEFEVSEAILEDALISKESDGQFVTVYGQDQHGMSEKLIMLLFSRHAFTRACFSDLVVGGLSSVSLEPGVNNIYEDDFRMSTISAFDKQSLTSYSASLGSSALDIKERNDTMARESIAFFLEAGVELSPVVFERIARRVFETKRVVSGSIDYISCIEKELLKSEEPKLNSLEWINAMRRCVLSDPDYVIKCDPGKLNHRAYTGYLDQFQRMFNREYLLVQKFYDNTKQLILQVTDVDGQPLSPQFFKLRANQPGPFFVWLLEIEAADAKIATLDERRDSSVSSVLSPSVSSLWNFAASTASTLKSSATNATASSRGWGSFFG